MPSADRPLNVVVVGGGGAGSLIARDLSAKLDANKHRLILITESPHFTHLPGCIRALVTSDGSLEKRIFMPYDRLLSKRNGKLVIGAVTSIEEGDDGTGGAVLLSSGEKIFYHVLVLCPGSMWSGPLALPKARPELDDWISMWRKKFAQSHDIVLIGGGAVSVELSGEIKDQWPEKRVTIVHKHSMILNSTYPVKWRQDIQTRLRERGVNLILNESVDVTMTHNAPIVTEKGGHPLECDLLVHTFGPQPNTAFIKSLGEKTLTDGGFVRIMPTLQLINHPHVFAAGDVLDFKEEKQVGKCYNHVPVVVTNVLAVLDGRKPRRIYKGSYEMIVLTIGKTRGTSYFGVLWGLIFGNFVSTLIKSKNLLITPTRQKLGLS